MAGGSLAMPAPCRVDGRRTWPRHCSHTLVEITSYPYVTALRFDTRWMVNGRTRTKIAAAAWSDGVSADAAMQTASKATGAFSFSIVSELTTRPFFAAASSASLAISALSAGISSGTVPVRVPAAPASAGRRSLGHVGRRQRQIRRALRSRIAIMPRPRPAPRRDARGPRE